MGPSLRVRAAQCGTQPTHPRPALASHPSPSRSTRTSPPAPSPSTTRTDLSGPTTCSPRPASLLRPPSPTVGPTAWTPRTRAATPTSTTSITLTPTHTSTPGTTTQCSIHTRPTAQRWIPGLTLCCCPVWGTRASRLPARGAPRTARGWRQRWSPAATAPSWLPLSPGRPRPSMDHWRCMTQVDTTRQIHHNLHMYSTSCATVTLPSLFLSCSSWSNQSKDVSLVLADALKDYQFTPKRTYYVALSTYGCNTSTVMYNVD